MLFPTPTEDLFSDRLLPDLQTLPPKDLRLLHDPSTGKILIRFSNSILNSGPGKLELIGTPNQTKDQILVSQRVYAADPEIYDEFKVGEFIFHEQHNHWHLEQFAIYEVWSVGERGILEAVVSSGGKVSYCVMDVSRSITDLAEEMISTPRSYTHCEGEIQGLSAGWVDIYESHIPGQWVDITSLRDGIYALVSTVNPDHLLHEEDIDNNTAVIYFEIRDLILTIIGEHLLEEEDFLIPNSYLKP